jgi:lipopolysaccharide export system ATP-binding protein
VNVLDAEGLRVERGGKVLLRDVTVHAEAGDVLGVLGPSGAGKSTLFRAMMGELEPDAGSVRLEGEDISSWPLWRRARAGMGYVPQGPSVLWDLTVRQNLITFQEVALGVTGDVTTAAERVDLGERLEVRAGELSAGERRRLEVARALVRTPKVLICDEPFAGVDPAGAQRLGDILSELASDGVAVLLADHHVAEALRVCTRAVLLLDGAVAVEADPGEFRDHELVRGRYLGTWTRSIPPPP